MQPDTAREASERGRKGAMGLRQQILAIGIAAMAVLFLIAMGFDLYVFHINQDANRRYNEGELGGVETFVRAHMSNIASTLDALCADQSAASLIVLRRNAPGWPATLHARALISRISGYVSINPDVYSLNLVLPGVDFVASEGGQSDLRTFRTRFQSAQLAELTQSKQAYPLRVFAGSTSGAYTMDSSIPVQIHAFSANRYALAMLAMSQDNVNNKFARQFMGKDMSVYTLTEQGALYSWYEPGGTPLPAAEVAALHAGTESTTVVNGQARDVLRASASSLSIVVLFRRNSTEAVFRQNAVLLAGMVVAFLALAALLYIVMLRWFYRPMNALLAGFEREGQPRRKENEYRRIDRAIGDMRTSIDLLEQSVREGMARTKHQQQGALDALFIDAEQTASAPMSAYDRVFSLVIEDGRGALLAGKCRRLCLLMGAVFELSMIYDHSGALTGILGMPTDDAPDAQLRGMLASVLEPGDYARLSLSAACDARARLPAAYAQCRDAFDGVGEGPVVVYEPAMAAPPARYAMTLSQQTHLAGCLTGGDEAALREALDDIYAQNRAVGRAEQCRLSRYLLDLLAVLSGYAQCDGAEEPGEAPTTSCNPEILRGRVYARYLKRVCLASAHSGQDELSEQIKQYIEAHLGEAGLSLTDVAENVNRSYNYVSACFSKATGMTFSAYVQKRRIALAMRALAETDESVSQIALRVGYEAPSSFIRLFKKEAGVTPGQYRDAAASARKDACKDAYKEEA